MFNLFLVSAIVMGLLSLLALVIGLVGFFRALKRASKRPNNRFVQPGLSMRDMKSGPAKITAPAKPVEEIASYKLQNKLASLIGGNRDTAERLLNQVKVTHPGKSLNWYFEKVIYDLERDRH